VRYNRGASPLVSPLWMTITALDAQRHRPIGDLIPARTSHLRIPSLSFRHGQAVHTVYDPCPSCLASANLTFAKVVMLLLYLSLQSQVSVVLTGRLFSRSKAGIVGAQSSVIQNDVTGFSVTTT